MFDTADLDSTVEGIVDAIWFNQGQVMVHSHYAIANVNAKFLFDVFLAHLVYQPKSLI